jgi:phosphoribosyl-ATP pyrophosphohydrolase
LSRGSRFEPRGSQPEVVLPGGAVRAAARAAPHGGAAAGGRPSWTAKLLADPALACAKVREEAGELAATLEAGEGAERAASEAADLLYHALVLLNLQARAAPGSGPRVRC